MNQSIETVFIEGGFFDNWKSRGYGDKLDKVGDILLDLVVDFDLICKGFDSDIRYDSHIHRIKIGMVIKMLEDIHSDLGLVEQSGCWR